MLSSDRHDITTYVRRLDLDPRLTDMRFLLGKLPRVDRPLAVHVMHRHGQAAVHKPPTFIHSEEGCRSPGLNAHARDISKALKIWRCCQGPSSAHRRTSTP